MFGYVTINKPELKIKDYARYREYYCGICRALKTRHGIGAQLSLSYDAAFAAVLLSALYEPETERRTCRCIMHPSCRKHYRDNHVIAYVADMNMVLGYYKCLDDWADEKKVLPLAYSGVIRRHVKAVKQRYGKKVSVIRDKIKALSVYEGQRADAVQRVDGALFPMTHDIDIVSGIFGDIMGEILAVSPNDLQHAYDETDTDCSRNRDSVRGDGGFLYREDWSLVLRELGYWLGRFIYIMDAYEDVREDAERGCFNPFLHQYKTMEWNVFSEWVRQLLMMTAADMAKAYECLPIVEEVGILRNIIYSGIWTRFFSIWKGRKGNDERSL